MAYLNYRAYQFSKELDSTSPQSIIWQREDGVEKFYVSVNGQAAPITQQLAMSMVYNFRTGGTSLENVNVPASVLDRWDITKTSTPTYGAPTPPPPPVPTPAPVEEYNLDLVPQGFHIPVAMIHSNFDTLIGRLQTILPPFGWRVTGGYATSEGARIILLKEGSITAALVVKLILTLAILAFGTYFTNALKAILTLRETRIIEEENTKQGAIAAKESGAISSEELAFILGQYEQNGSIIGGFGTKEAIALGVVALVIMDR